MINTNRAVLTLHSIHRKQGTLCMLPLDSWSPSLDIARPGSVGFVSDRWSVGHSGCISLQYITLSCVSHTFHIPSVGVSDMWLEKHKGTSSSQWISLQIRRLQGLTGCTVTILPFGSTFTLTHTVYMYDTNTERLLGPSESDCQTYRTQR